MLEKDLHEVIEVDGEGLWALVEGLCQAPDDHNVVALSVLVAQVLHKLGAKALQVGKERILESFAQGDHKVCRIAQNQLVMVQVVLVHLFAVIIIIFLLFFGTVNVDVFALTQGLLVEEFLNDSNDPLKVVFDAPWPHLFCKVSDALQDFLNDLFAHLLGQYFLQVRDKKRVDELLHRNWQRLLRREARSPLKLFIAFCSTEMEPELTEGDLSECEAAVVPYVLVDVASDFLKLFADALQVRLH